MRSAFVNCLVSLTFFHLSVFRCYISRLICSVPSSAMNFLAAEIALTIACDFDRP